MKLTGAEIFIECLKREGVKTLFALPGGVVLKIFDMLHQQKDIEVVLTRHEQGAGHMAEGYAKATGKAGVCLVTSGPGMTNVITALADAYMDSVPLVCFSGQVPTSLIGNDAFQEADNVGLSRPCTKYNFLVKDVNELASTIKEAFYIATTGRPGPVLVDIPKDVSMDKAEFKYPNSVSIRGYNPTYEGNKWQIKQAAEAIMKAKKPILYVGGGVDLLRSFQGIDRAGGTHADSRGHDAHGTGRVPGRASVVSRHDGHAWNLSSQYGGPLFRPRRCDRRTF